MSDIENNADTPIETVGASETPESVSTEEISTEEAPSEASDDNTSDDSDCAVSSEGEAPDHGKAFAAVKKKSREKGYNEGYAAARTELEQMQQQYGASTPATSVQAMPQPPANTAPMSPEQVRAYALQLEIRSQFGEDVEKKVQALTIQAHQNAAMGSPVLQKVLQHAVQLGRPEAFKLLVDNPAKRAELYENPSPAFWTQELLKASAAKPAASAPAETAPKSVKLPPEPLSEIRSEPAKGKRSREEWNQYVLKMNRR